ncbi:MAG: hypothetical protein AABO41_05285 [Acidobacteriota bacterium]
MKANNSKKTPRKGSRNLAQAASLRSTLVLASSAITPAQVALGFRVKSGRAIAVVLAGPPESPQVLARREVKLCDPAEPDSMQPYHAALEMPGQTAAKAIERLVKIVRRAANASVGELIEEWRGAGHEICGAGLVVGSLIDPATITNDHIRAHALEGQLFRVSVQEALVKNGLTSVAIPERDVYLTTATALGKSEDELKRTVSELGRALAGPWRADEKTAALAAWMVLRSSNVQRQIAVRI